MQEIPSAVRRQQVGSGQEFRAKCARIGDERFWRIAIRVRHIELVRPRSERAGELSTACPPWRDRRKKINPNAMKKWILAADGHEPGRPSSPCTSNAPPIILSVVSRCRNLSRCSPSIFSISYSCFIFVDPWQKKSNHATPPLARGGTAPGGTM